MKAQNTFTTIFSKNYKAYAVFLILTLILWFVIQLTKSYNFQNQLSIQISNIPKHIVLNPSSKELDVNLKANGFKLWRYNLYANSLEVDFKEFEKDSFQLIVSANRLKTLIAENYELDFDNIDLDQMLLTFDYKRKQTKMVPVKPNLNLSYASGYNTTDSLKVLPDSVVISGSESSLKNVRFVETKKTEINNVNDTLKGEIQLIKPDEKVEISNDKVEYYLPVEKFSEKALMVDINTINVPDSLALNVFPNQARVSFLVALKSFDKIASIDFKVICDYSKRYQEDAIMIPKLVKYPDNIINPKLSIRKVDYLVKQKL